MTQTLLEVLPLLAVVAVGAAVAPRVGLLTPILLLLVGVVASFLPVGPEYHLDPELILVGVLPLLLYVASIETSVPAFRKNLQPIAFLAFGHVLFIALVVGFVLHAVVSAVPLPAAFALGAVVAPPDAVAATAIAKRIGLPRRVVTILEGESLINDATALVTLRMAVAATTAGAAVTWQEFGLAFVVAAFGGMAIGGVVGVVIAWLHQRTDDPLVDNTISLLTPFLAFVPAEHIDASGVVAVVTCGLYIGHRRPELMGSAARLQMDAFWRVVRFMLEGVVFVLVGLQLRLILERLDYPLPTLALASVAVTVTVIGGRFAWVVAGTFASRLRFRRRRRAGKRDRGPGLEQPLVISWAGMRGVVSLAAATSLPLDFPTRDLLLWLTFVVIVVTLVGQGLTLPTFVRWLGVPRDNAHHDQLREAETRQAAYRAAVRRLDELAADGDGVASSVAERLRALAENRAHQAWEQLGRQDREPPSEAFARIRLQMLETEREVFRQARDDGRIPDEVFTRVSKEVDMEEMLLDSRRRDRGWWSTGGQEGQT